jgi:hypothetical protein
VGEVNISQTFIQLGDETGQMRVDTFTGVTGTVLVLDYMPIDGYAPEVHRGGVLQRLDDHYTISDGVLFFLSALEGEDVAVRYLHAGVPLNAISIEHVTAALPAGTVATVRLDTFTGVSGTTVTLAYLPQTGAYPVKVWRNGMLQVVLEHYTILGGVVTFLNALEVENVSVDYMHTGTPVA